MTVFLNIYLSKTTSIKIVFIAANWITEESFVSFATRKDEHSSFKSKYQTLTSLSGQM